MESEAAPVLATGSVVSEKAITSKKGGWKYEFTKDDRGRGKESAGGEKRDAGLFDGDRLGDRVSGGRLLRSVQELLRGEAAEGGRKMRGTAPLDGDETGE